MVLQSGQIIEGRFEIIKLLGVGGMGRVYQAKQLDLNRPVALKFLDSDLANDDEEWRLRFIREARALSKVQHKNVAACYSFGIIEQETNGLPIPFLCMELVEGSSLASLMETQQGFEEEQALEIALQIAAGMESVHLHDIVHRDLKLENILVETNPSANHSVIVKIIDFGLSRKLLEENDTLTATGALLGSPLSMSPEQCMGKRADKRSDTYALGCILYTLLTGKPPFDADTAIAVFHKHINEIPMLPDNGGGKPLRKGLAQVVLKSLSKNPDDRYQTMSEFGRDLALVRAGQANLLNIKMPDANSDKRRIYITTALVISLLLAVGLFFTRIVKPSSNKGDLVDTLKYKGNKTSFSGKSRKHKLSEYIGGLTESIDTADRLLRMAEDDKHSLADREAFMIKALEIKKKILGAKDQAVGHALVSLASLCYFKGDIEKTQKLLLEALDIAQQKTLDPLIRFNLLSRVGKDMSLLGQMPKLALPTLETSLALARQRPHEFDEYLPLILPELANLYSLSGHRGKAKAAMEQCIKLREKMPLPISDVVGGLSENEDYRVSIFVIYDYVNLANIYEEEGDFVKAKELLMRSIRRRLLDKSIAAIDEGYFRLASYYDRIGNLKEAEKVVTSHIDLDKDLMNVILFVPKIYYKQKKLDEAEKFCSYLLSHYEKHPRADFSKETVFLLLADIYEQKGDYRRYEDSLDRAILELRRRESAADDLSVPDPSIISIKMELASALERAGRFLESEKIWEQVLQIEDAQHAGPREKIRSLNELARFAAASGKYVAAKNYNQRSLSLVESASKYDYLDETTVWRNAGSIARQAGDFRSAEEWLKKCLARHEREKNDGAIASDCLELAKLCAAEGKTEMENRYLERFAQLSLGKKSWQSVDAAVAISEHLQDRGPMAATYLKNALVLSSNLESNPRKTAELQCRLALNMADQGKLNEAKELMQKCRPYLEQLKKARFVPEKEKLSELAERTFELLGSQNVLKQ